MQIPDKEFATWKVVLVTSLMALEPLDDDVVIADKLNPTDMSPARLQQRVKEAEKPVLKFRNYSVKDEKIKHEKLDQVKVAEEEVPEVDLDHVIGEDTEEVIANVAPKKPNWDLRREIAGN
eukprot:jgi/Picre1/32660/NNA_008006.t1